jgi:hypothetical protein
MKTIIRKIIPITSAALVLMLSLLAVAGPAVAAKPTGLKAPRITTLNTTFTPEPTGNYFMSTEVSWKEVKGATVYQVCYVESGRATCQTGYTMPPGTVELSGVPPNTTLEFYVVACESTDPSAMCVQSPSEFVTSPAS